MHARAIYMIFAMFALIETMSTIPGMENAQKNLVSIHLENRPGGHRTALECVPTTEKAKKIVQTEYYSHKRDREGARGGGGGGHNNGRTRMKDRNKEHIVCSCTCPYIFYSLKLKTSTFTMYSYKLGFPSSLVNNLVENIVFHSIITSLNKNRAKFLETSIILRYLFIFSSIAHVDYVEFFLITYYTSNNVFCFTSYKFIQLSHYKHLKNVKTSQILHVKKYWDTIYTTIIISTSFTHNNFDRCLEQTQLLIRKILPQI
ncbi:hypothetical protein ACJX0J_029261, partial [Zea mays]